MSVKDNILAIKRQLPKGVELVAVSKFHPAVVVMQAYDAGQRIFGENRAQELASKAPQLPSDIRWHFIGHLQTNKVRQVVPHAAMIESVDSVRLLQLINKEALRIGRVIDVLLQLHVAQEEAKSGFAVEELLTALTLGEMNGLEGVRIRGLMAMASLTDDQAQIDREFSIVENTFNAVKEEFYPEDRFFDQISMGMSDDWPIAVKHGSTLVRIGTAIFGEREY
ncbi:MAG: YggS family pyridoxal phosphate-dependent enzyme [Muribaculaceae bacterium]|nr:YggS family pyridoxal phosphate-dependent enzyme [Muribaculaceae bacterium]